MRCFKQSTYTTAAMGEVLPGGNNNPEDIRDRDPAARGMSINPAGKMMMVVMIST